MFNQYSAGFEVLRKTSTYNIESHGDLSATSAYLVTNDFPEYAGMFYHPTEHEIINSIKYRTENPGYDSGFRELQESMQGTPMEFYIPRSVQVDDGVGSSRTMEVINPFKEASDKISKGILNEIEKAQEEIKGKTLVLRDIQIDETLVLKRHIRKREILFRSKDI